MTLKLDQVYGQVAAMSAALATSRDEMTARLECAVAEWGSAWSDEDRVRGKVEAAKTSWLLARPLEPPGSRPLPAQSPPRWRIIATDGSQIEVSRHEIASCFLVNVGEVVLDYGDDPGARLGSAPSLYFEPGDLYPIYGDEERSADGAIVAAVRDTQEFHRLAELAAEADRPAVALVDGTLILWRDETNPRGLAGLAPDDVKKKRLDAMLELFEAGERAGVPVVGYVSSPGGSDVVNALKVLICPEDPVDCDRCPFTPPDKRPSAVTDKPCDAVLRVTDAQLFRRVLKAGERSPLFWSGAPVLQAYGRHRVAFCYLDVNDEMARLEVPGYVAESPELMELAHWAAADQARRGYGYPVALAEAHEQAIVRWADREAFFRLVARRFVREGHRVVLSAKQLRKRGALV
ncbi:MAG: DNA double-strand break repair nuclease NurA [Actinomycetota bacterium]